MSATDELREMLDERGIEYEQSCIEGVAEYTHVTKWKAQTGNMCAFCEVEDGYPPYFTRLDIWTPTPEQAIAATVGRGTCHNTCEPSVSHRLFECSECGSTHLRTPAFIVILHYCPNCGRRVVE